MVRMISFFAVVDHALLLISKMDGDLKLGFLKTIVHNPQQGTLAKHIV
jgi:hypothetical protein